MKMKSKISYGLGLLFFLIFVVSGFSIYYINKISSDARDIIKDNYKSLEYVSEMNKSMDIIRNHLIDLVLLKNNEILGDNNDYGFAVSNFDTYLKAEENNITEPGEKESADLLRTDYNKIIESSKILLTANERHDIYLKQIKPVLTDIDKSLSKIHFLNMNAISKKNEMAKVSSDRIIVIMSALIAVCIILAIFYYLYFPKYVSIALSVLSSKMKEIAASNYNQRLNLKSNDEFGEISKSFDLLVAHLQEKEGNAR